MTAVCNNDSSNIAIIIVVFFAERDHNFLSFCFLFSFVVVFCFFVFSWGGGGGGVGGGGVAWETENTEVITLVENLEPSINQ